MTYEVELTWAEVFQAAMVGVMRRLQNLQRNTNAAYGIADAVAWQHDIDGALGELATAKALGRFWSGSIGHWRADDVYTLQVRTTGNLRNRLILHDADEDEKIFILCCGCVPKYSLRGWIRAYDGKDQRFWNDPTGGRPAYFVPQSALRPMSDLRLS